MYSTISPLFSYNHIVEHAGDRYVNVVTGDDKTIITNT